jgi:predicted nuclease of predicted toxin-antitoxin system
MKFKIDENLPIDVSLILKDFGYDSITIIDQNLSGAEDQKIAQVCERENRILITLDIHFSDIRRYPPSQFPGIIILRLTRQDKYQILQMMRKIIKLLDKEKIDRKLWIVSENKIRIRS